jgi:hypothetical protein
MGEIPKIAHFISLSEPTVLTTAVIQRFVDLHPEWDVRVCLRAPRLPAYLRNISQRAPRRRRRVRQSDLIRYWLLFEYGGVYLDTDVIVLQNLDRFLHQPNFIMTTGKTLNPAVMGAMRHDTGIERVIRRCMGHVKQGRKPFTDLRNYGPPLATRFSGLLCPQAEFWGPQSESMIDSSTAAIHLGRAKGKWCEQLAPLLSEPGSIALDYILQHV